MVKEALIGMGIVAFGTLIGSVGALLFKLASANVNRNPLSLLKNSRIYGGTLLYGLSALIFVYALRFGDLSALYPVAGLSYVWISLLSIKFLGEKMNGYRWTGISLIIFGVVFIGLGA